MASSFCWNCFSKLHPTPRPGLVSPQCSLPRSSQRAPFHHSTAQYGAPPKKSSAHLPKFRESRGVTLRSRPPPAKPKRYSPEELKAMRQPVSLSNANALDIPNMQILNAENLADEGARGKVLAVPQPYLQRLRVLRAFKKSQHWGMFKTPATLVREETLQLARLIDGINGQGEMKGKSSVNIVTGDRGTGKTMHLFQAMTMGLMKNWVVISVPSARDYVSGATAYAPLRDSEPIEYVQKDATAELLNTVSEANAGVLSNLHVSQRHEKLGSQVTAQSSLYDLARFGAMHSESSRIIFEALWKELTATAPAADAQGTKPFQPRPPMLVTVDSLSHWMTNSSYFNAQYKPIHAQDLTLVKHFLSLLASPASAFPNGGLAFFATSTCNSPSSPAFDISIKQLVARKNGVDPASPNFPLPAAYQKIDDRTTSLFNSINANESDAVGVQEFRGIPREDTRGLLEYYALSGITREQISEDYVGEKWTLAGGGVVGQLEKFGRRIRASP